MSKLATKVAQEQGKEEEIAGQVSELPAAEISSISEQPVLRWLLQMPPAFDTILEELNEIREVASGTEDKLKSLLDIASTQLQKKSRPMPSTGTASAESSSSTTVPPNTQARAKWGYAFQSK